LLNILFLFLFSFDLTHELLFLELDGELIIFSCG